MPAHLGVNMSQLTHVDASGAAHMVDVGGKEITIRTARALAMVYTRPDVIALIENAQLKKGDVLAVARIAGIMAAKKTPELIPLCHPLALTKISIDMSCDAEKGEISIISECRLQGQTGVEMEALTAASVAALTIYDMCKAVDAEMIIGDIKLLTKTGGKQGNWQRGITAGVAQ